RQVLDCCNGLVLLKCWLGSGSARRGTFVVCNPATKKWAMVDGLHSAVPVHISMAFCISSLAIRTSLLHWTSKDRQIEPFTFPKPKGLVSLVILKGAFFMQTKMIEHKLFSSKPLTTSIQSVAIKHFDKLQPKAKDNASLHARASRVAGSDIPSKTLALAAMKTP
ncbi:hypothetical protein EJB05_05029, partial [Eragrostis curvula]